uniref:Homeobox domain-containing protein n=1 Tax=Myripristis murdjan TaxID=586833 RepID=A0A667WXY6_9TELE
MNSLKRKLEEKAGTSPGENDSTNSGEEPQRDKRLRTTITPEHETSSLADPCSPSPGASGSRSVDSGDRPGQKRFRTQMTNLQLKVLKSCFNDYRTPTMLECEVLGNDIGLPKRVVQVWFQNARAKEKKAKLSMAKHFGINQTSYEGPKTECTLCGVKYSARLSVRDHIFSQQHISKVKDTIGSQLDKEKEYFDPATPRPARLFPTQAPPPPQYPLPQPPSPAPGLNPPKSVMQKG